ncbi:MAG: Asparaginase [Polaromonas sp.]|nr:Asparaginase [Polaromonas sp.]
MNAPTTHMKRVIVLGTGGTIAGSGGLPGANVGYTAGTIPVSDLLTGITGPADLVLEGEQVAQLDSKDMELETWLQLRARCVHWLAQADVAGVVITHGTDTIEETAFFLASTVATSKPIVLTCAMRPATALSPDGPQNLRDALSVAADPAAAGVVVVCAGEIHGARHVSKSHPYRLNAFSSGDIGPLGYVEEGQVRLVHGWPSLLKAEPTLDPEIWSAGADWPRVEILMSHAGASGMLLDLLADQREAGVENAVEGVVIAATGNGSLHQVVEAAAQRAKQRGVAVLIASRCGSGKVLRPDTRGIEDAADLNAPKARIALMLALLCQSRGTHL